VLAEDLKLSEIVDFNEGFLSLKGRRLVLHDIYAFAQLRKDLFEMIGAEHTRRILTRFGYFWGKADAAAMKRIFRWTNLNEWVKAGPRLHTLQGVVKVQTKHLEIDEASGRFRMDVVWHNSGEAEEHLIAAPASASPVCWMLAGYASGYASFCLGKNVYFIECLCRGKGDRVCSAEGKDEGAWGAELSEHLPYFRIDDVQGKIEELSRELRQKTRELARERKRAEELDAGRNPLQEIRSPAYQRIMDLATRIAPFDSSVLITGETGTGKEVLARFIHSLSRRAKAGFFAINCGALPETLLESELFGHKAGSFTGATHDRAGLLEQAEGGTIFLDEIGDISPALQLKLLRVLQEREILRVGESKPRKINVRILSATNRDLARAIEEKKFREDLFYRLSVIEIEVPPLRKRQDDLLPLARHFIAKLSVRLGIRPLRLDSACLDHLLAYSWPGNVRELENALERAALLCKAGVITPADLPRRIIESGPNSEVPGPKKITLAEMEQAHIKGVLESVNGNKTKAAEILDISAATLWRKLKNPEG